MWINKPFFKYACAIILIILIIFLLGKIDYVLLPLQKIIAAMFFPIIVAGLLYYILRPVVNLLTEFIPRSASIFTVFLIIFSMIGMVGYFGSPVIVDQFQKLSENLPSKVKEFSKESEVMEVMIEKNDFGMVNIEELKEKAVRHLKDYSEKLIVNVNTILSTITSVLTVLVITPFILFYFLKDGDKLRPFLLKYIPNDVESEGNTILKDVDKALSTYIIGQFIISIVIGTLMYVGYLIIGLDYALVLALFAMIFTVVPFLGPLISIIPALFIALQQDIGLAVKVLIVLIVVQQVEGHLVTPNIMGKRLNIHPLTIILLLLAAGSIYGFIGILIAIPTYSVVKTIIGNFRKFHRLRKRVP
ncbi:AI-2E family transporter [Peribacillus frigoritolerans]|uniref:AI-2E family transporter n=1 Tax=Peribacillus frigoritolerans TaxID=450367 RepID=UPI003D08AAFB